MARARELIHFLVLHGYRESRQSGSHLILEHPTRKTLVIPVHARDLPKGLLLRIPKDAGFTLEEFRRN
jgi:predicted RNA binding protein YcfA (HicA-like mRNA interferase family)